MQKITPSLAIGRSPIRRVYRLIRLSAMGLLAALVLAACGGSSGSEASPTGWAAENEGIAVSDPATVDLRMEQMGVLNDDDFAIFAAQVLATDRADLSEQAVFELGVLVLNSDDLPRDFIPMDGTDTRLLRTADLEYQPPTLERDGEGLVYTFWASGAHFGDVVEITAEHSVGGKLNVAYEFLYWA